MKSATPLNFQELSKLLPDNFSNFERELVQRAYKTAEKSHEGQKRASGEPYINHCLAVASILVEMGMPSDVIAAGLLHDTVEDTLISLDDVRRDFGDTVANLVDGVTKLTHLPRVSRAGEDFLSEKQSSIAETETNIRNRKHELTIETLRKTFLAMGEDVRVILIKLADRLHNMRTLGFFPEKKRKRIAQETLDIFAPLANRLGIWQIKWELEDLAFRYAQPEKYKEIAEQLSERRENRESQVQQIVENLTHILAENNIKVEISGRPKHIYSIYKKMVEKGKPFELVRDIRAVRIIVSDVPACYSTLGIIHTHWRPIPNEFDDYIAAPKDNFYQSLHTVVIYDDGKPVEVQIRTQEMDQSAEFGIAAHWRYKEGGQPAKYDERINWLRKMMEWRTDVDDAQEFVDSMKTDVFKDRVYVFTPRGDIIDLPAGSTPIDFAYHVHTDVGNHCRGAKINGKLVPLDHELKTGDQVEILAAKQGGPSRDWLNSSLGLVRTQRARSKIRAWFKKQDREQNEQQGKLMLTREIVRLGMQEPDERTLQELASKLNRSLEELYLSIGCGDLSIVRTINFLLEAKESDDSLVVVPPTSESSSSDAVTVLGLKDILTNFAKCCNPTPGDEIIGYITRGRGATVHRMDCPNILRIRDRERLIKVSWGEKVRTYPVSIRVSAYDRQGLMGDLSNLLESESVNILDVNVRVSKNLADLRLIIEVKDIAQLSRLLSRMENIPNVLEAQRVKGG
ncbi:MAG: (p)ppGpp synthetase [Chloroflexi bacterium GWB2_49_20]|nr:MAG: (p)ppGpp synthetase [Chloroflexi bacterium GWB2_49_20]OGN78496.1 MAG: (p)ppGpp synthetase [Chloroflexi bacterium GWC2_49_37]OGN84041.1 MAG: (p)ppGpp synthetase [Chloroflexi bacterium GWD2_49_16]HBG75315.1 (p)ppGpp synthetase [Anaerolineae bacterium]HCC79051.1 (p)ppGpp synthetase [Anaerolineae bacterium]